MAGVAINEDEAELVRENLKRCGLAVDQLVGMKRPRIEGNRIVMSPAKSGMTVSSTKSGSSPREHSMRPPQSWLGTSSAPSRGSEAAEVADEKPEVQAEVGEEKKPEVQAEVGE